MAESPMTLRSRRLDFPELKNKREKEQAVAHFQKLNVPEKLEELLNKACTIKPDDLYGYMSAYFLSLAKEPSIASLSVLEGLDSNGGKSVEVDIHCSVCGVDKLVSTASFSASPVTLLIELAVATPIKASGGKKLKSSSRTVSPAHSSYVTSPTQSSYAKFEKKVNFIDTVKTEIGTALNGMPVGKQSEVDQVLENLRLKAEGDKLILHPSAMLAVSCAVAMAGSHLSSTPLFLYLSSALSSAHLHARPGPDAPRRPSNVGSFSFKVDVPGPADVHEKNTEEPSDDLNNKKNSIMHHYVPQKYTIPSPVVAVLGQGTGKLRVREFCLCPLPPSPLPQQINMLERVFHELGKLLSQSAKLGTGSRLPNGAHSSSLDKFEQGIDLIKEATVNAGLQINTDVAVLIDIGADLLYDEDKGKYEIISGHWKTTDEVIMMYSDLLLHSNDSILGFIDPLHPKDVSGWKKLISKLSGKCVLMADYALQKGLPLVQTRDSDGIGLQVGGDASPKQGKEGAGDSLRIEQDQAEGGGTESGIEGLPCAALTWELSISSTMDKADHLKGCSQAISWSTPPNLTVNTVVADLAVATHCKFIRLGAPIAMTTLLLNRLLHIHEELTNRKILEPTQTILFASDQQ